MRRIYLSKVVRLLAAMFAVLALVCSAGLWTLYKYPSIAAYGSDTLRSIFGDRAVAAMETVLYQVQDSLNQAEYRSGLLKPSNPFGETRALPRPKNGPARTGGSQPQSVAPLAKAIPANPAHQAAPQQAVPVVQPREHANPNAWSPPPVHPNGTQPGEGVWQPYLFDDSGQVVAYRTFVQPDLSRPYVAVGVVAFDLHAVRLHYVIGYEDPYASKKLTRQSGAIPPADLKAGRLIAAFNGGFKFRHGHFGSMANGFTSVPMQNGLGVVAMYQDGTVKIGQWGSDINSTPDLVAARQNGPLVIQDGQISALVDTPKYWGFTLSGETVTWRSGMAISPDGQTLYYFAGPSISTPTLAVAMSAVHPRSAIQLDINDFWVYFAAVQSAGDHLESVPLFPKKVTDGNNRYLHPYSRDFFYVTASSAS